MFFDLQYMLRPTFSVEVGAYEAHFSRQMKESYPPINAYAFEAAEANYRKFKHDLENAWGVNYIHSAVSNIDGHIYFNLQEGLPEDVPNNSVLPRIGANNKQLSVPSTTLDTFFIDSGRMSPTDTACLWLDVEGAAGLVMEGGKRFLAQTTSVLVEVEHQYFWEKQWLSTQVHDFLLEQGFSFLARDYEYYPTQENYLYVKAPF